MNETEKKKVPKFIYRFHFSFKINLFFFSKMFLIHQCLLSNFSLLKYWFLKVAENIFVSSENSRTNFLNEVLEKIWKSFWLICFLMFLYLNHCVCWSFFENAQNVKTWVLHENAQKKIVIGGQHQKTFLASFFHFWSTTPLHFCV